MLRREDAVLLFIDVQGRLHEVMHGKEVLDRNLERMVCCAQRLDIPRIATEQLPQKLGPTSEPFRTLLSDVPVISKSSFSCCGDPGFMKTFRSVGRKQAILTGIEAHICIYQTALDLLALDIEVFVVADAISSRTPENKALALQAMRDAGARILPAESVLFALLRDAAHPLFKELLKWVK